MLFNITTHTLETRLNCSARIQATSLHEVILADTDFNPTTVLAAALLLRRLRATRPRSFSNRLPKALAVIRSELSRMADQLDRFHFLLPGCFRLIICDCADNLAVFRHSDTNVAFGPSMISQPLDFTSSKCIPVLGLA